MKNRLLPVFLLAMLSFSCSEKNKIYATNNDSKECCTINYNFIEVDRQSIDIKMYKDFILMYRNLNKNDLNEIIDSTLKYANEPKIMLSIFSVESKFNKNAISYLGKDYGIGIGQVSLIGLTDYNWKNNTNYTQNDLYDIDKNIMIACWIFDYNEKYGVNGINKKIIAYNEGHVSAKNKNRSNYLDKVIERAYAIGYKGEIYGRKGS